MPKIPQPSYPAGFRPVAGVAKPETPNPRLRTNDLAFACPRVSAETPTHKATVWRGPVWLGRPRRQLSRISGCSVRRIFGIGVPGVPQRDSVSVHRFGAFGFGRPGLEPSIKSHLFLRRRRMRHKIYFSRWRAGSPIQNIAIVASIGLKQ